MAVLTCGWCRHPGVHAKPLPLGGSGSRYCEDCARCEKESRQPDGPERQRGRHSATLRSKGFLFTLRRGQHEG
jgi:hypothetical protein